MFRRKPFKSEIGNTDLQSVSKTSLGDVPPIVRANNVKSWVYNTDLKYAICDLRNQLINEAKNTNPSMKQKIQDWVARDYEEAACHIATKDTPVARENEAMRQLISDLLNGPIASLLNKDGRNKLSRLSIPALPTNGIFFYEDTNLDDYVAFPVRSGPTYNSNSFTTNSYDTTEEDSMDEFEN